MNKIRIGIVGTGFIAGWHYQGFLKNPQAQVTGLCSYTRTEKLLNMAKEWNVRPYDNFDAMVEDPEIDALVIGSINPEHFKQVTKTIELGKHVLVEKPVVTDFGQLDEIIKSADEKGTVVFPGHNFVYRGAVQKAKEIVDKGGIGKIVYASFMSSHTISENHSGGWRGKTALSSGGALMDSGHHLTYMSLFFMGMPAKIQAFKSNLVLNTMEGEDIAQVNLLYPNGSIGTIMQSWTSGYADGINGVKLMGNKGSIQITDALYYNNEKLDTDVAYGDSFANQAKAFTESILKGTKPLSDLKDARDTLKLIYGAYSSAENNQVTIFE